MDRAYETLPEVLRSRARKQGERLAFRFLSEKGDLLEEHTYGSLDRRARAIAGALQRHGETGERVLLIYPPGLEFLAAFMACQYCGKVAVPLQPPGGLRPRSHAHRAESPGHRRLMERLDKVAKVVEHSGATTVLTAGKPGEAIESIREMIPAIGRLRFLATDRLHDETAEEWIEPVYDPDGLALLQYTSGSTSSPRGVAVGHRHLVANAAAINELARIGSDDSTVCWLPPYHDMGLIGNLLQQIFEGIPVTLMSPIAFMKRPAVWLRALSDYRGTLAAAPNFAFDLCADKATPELLSELDLSQARVVIVGAEPVRATTLERFTRTFEVCGFSPEALYPSYGLAESTLIVTGRAGVRSVAFDAQQLRNAKAHPAGPSDQATHLVSCGRPLRGADVRIVDPDNLEDCAEGDIGEIWVSSGHVAGGYYGLPKLSEEVFRASIPGSKKHYLRTGDAGVLHDGELFITGRYKDMMIFSGANHHPHDIEQSVTKAHEALQGGSAVAFAVQEDGRDRLVIGVELGRTSREELNSITDAIRRTVFADHGLRVDEVVPLRRRSVPRTSSGKPQRFLARQRFESGEFGGAT